MPVGALSGSPLLLPPCPPFHRSSSTDSRANTPRATACGACSTACRRASSRESLRSLLGRSGSGKSTLLNLIAGIDLPTSGRVRYGDTDLTDLSERERTLFRRRHIGFVFQSFNLIPTLTVGENVRLPLDLTGQQAGAEKKVADLLGAVGLADRARAFPDTLSGGEQQRVAVARALAHDPDLILADEPTGNLDLDTAERVVDALDTLARQMGKTLLVVTHDKSLARHADRVLTLQHGKLMEEESARVAR